MKLTVWPLKGSGTLLKQHCSITLVIALVPISEFKPRTSDLRTCLHTHNSLPESQCDGNFELLQLFQPMIDHIWNFNVRGFFWLVKTELQMVKNFVGEAFWQPVVCMCKLEVLNCSQTWAKINNNHAFFQLLRQSLTLKKGFQEFINSHPFFRLLRQSLTLRGGELYRTVLFQ